MADSRRTVGEEDSMVHKPVNITHLLNTEELIQLSAGLEVLEPFKHVYCANRNSNDYDLLKISLNMHTPICLCPSL